MLKAGKDDIRALRSPSYISIRVQHHHLRSDVTLDVSSLKDNETAGIMLMQSDKYNLRIVAGRDKCSMILCKDGKDEVVGSCDLSDVKKDDEVTFSLMINDLKAVGTVFDKVLGEADIRSLSTEVAGGFVGCTVGCYASANGSESDTYVKFRSLTYKPL